jgi:hypothetical protein
MLPFLRKRPSDKKEPAEPVAPPPAPETEASRTAPGVRMLKEVWKIEDRKRKEMPPAGVSTDIYCVPQQRQIRRRGGQAE